MSLASPLRIQVVSDLHVDVAPTALRLAAGADALVVAGDTCEGLDRAFAWLRASVPMPTPILVVAGNHEHYRGVLPEALAAAPSHAAAAGVSFLEDGEAVVGGVRFLGCTLWTDYALEGEPWRPLAIQAAHAGMNDHRRIAMSKRPWRRFLPADAMAMHRSSRAWLAAALAAPFDGPTVVVTHHAPSRRSLAPASARTSRGTALDACYASNRDELVAASGAALWILGHTHHPCGYAIGATRVLNNGRGYGGENAGTFDPALVVEIVR